MKPRRIRPIGDFAKEGSTAAERRDARRIGPAKPSLDHLSLNDILKQMSKTRTSAYPMLMTDHSMMLAYLDHIRLTMDEIKLMDIDTIHAYELAERFRVFVAVYSQRKVRTRELHFTHGDQVHYAHWDDVTQAAAEGFFARYIMAMVVGEDC